MYHLLDLNSSTALKFGGHIYVKILKLIENVQRRATKFILNDYSSVYKSRSLKLNLLPLTMIYDICFFMLRSS